MNAIQSIVFLWLVGAFATTHWLQERLRRDARGLKAWPHGFVASLFLWPLMALALSLPDDEEPKP